MTEKTHHRKIFLTGGTGYMGSRLLSSLMERGHAVRALTRDASLQKLPPGCEPVIGDALRRNSYAGKVRGCDTFVHLIGVPHPNPSKAEAFRRVDLASVEVAVAAAVEAEIRHFVYVSVAHPAPIMKTYWKVRAEGEALILGSGLEATILRPWYVLGPGHRWPYVLVPMYWLFERFSSTRSTAQRLGLVTLPEIIRALVVVVENPSSGVRTIEVPQIRGIHSK